MHDDKTLKKMLVCGFVFVATIVAAAPATAG